jgi:hypothetical protein
MQHMCNAYCWACANNCVYYLKQEYEHWSWRHINTRWRRREYKIHTCVCVESKELVVKERRSAKMLVVKMNMTYETHRVINNKLSSVVNALCVCVCVCEREECTSNEAVPEIHFAALLKLKPPSARYLGGVHSCAKPTVLWCKSGLCLHTWHTSSPMQSHPWFTECSPQSGKRSRNLQ